MAEPRFVVFQDAEGLWRFTLRGGNGEPMATSESYTRKRDCLRAIRALKVAVYRAVVV